jgi:glycosyltransferase involved in cell wall biosynthesis
MHAQCSPEPEMQGLSRPCTTRFSKLFESHSMPRPDGSLRVLLVGPPTSHLEHSCRVIRELGHEVILVSYDTRHGAAFAHLPLIEGNRRALTLWKLFRARAKFRKILRETRPDVVHAHWLTGPGWIAALAGAPSLIVSAWGSDALRWTPASGLARILVKIVGRNAAAVTYDADVVRAGLEDAGIPGNRMTRIVFGVDTTRFSPGSPRPDLLQRMGAAPQMPVILGPRGIDPVYRPETVIEAFTRITAHRSATLLLRVDPGQEHLLADLERRFGDLSASNVVPYASVHADDLPALLRSAAVIVSVPESDGSSVLLLEAIATETPVVVSDLPANREWVVNGCASIVPVGDADALSVAIEDVLENPERARDGMRALAVRVREQASIDGERSALELLYRRVSRA